MAFKFPSTEWVAAFKDAVNGNPAYKTSGREWTHGVITLVVAANPALGLAEDAAMWLDLHQGVCRDAKLLKRAEADATSAFVIVGDYARWKQVIRKELEPIKGMMQGKLKLTKGPLPVIVKFVAAAKELVQSTSAVDTKFIDE